MGEYEKTPSEDSFEFIETPPAPTPVPAPKDIGVRTTAVSEAARGSISYLAPHN
jgi:hypothetical protein